MLPCLSVPQILHSSFSNFYLAFIILVTLNTANKACRLKRCIWPAFFAHVIKAVHSNSNPMLDLLSITHGFHERKSALKVYAINLSVYLNTFAF